MAYVTGGKIEATDYDGFNTTLNSVLGTGTGNTGYGQTTLPTVAVAQKVTSSNWANLINSISALAEHQGTPISSVIAPVTGNKVTAFTPTIANNLTAIINARLNASTQGSTTSTTSTSVSTWNASLRFVFDVNFANDNAARYFFNAGGQFGLSFSHPSGSGSSINQLINSICSEIGTVWFSSPSSGTATLSAISYNGVTKVGGSNPGGTTVNSNNGFYSVYPSGTNTLITQYSNFTYYYYSSSYIRVSVTYDGAGKLTFSALIDEVPNGATVSSGTTCTLTLRPPSATYISNTWGNPVITPTIIYDGS